MAKQTYTRKFATAGAAKAAETKLGGFLEGDRLHFERGDAVFFDEGWDAWGWRHRSFVNGPFPSKAAAWRAFKDEVEAA